MYVLFHVLSSSSADSLELLSVVYFWNQIFLMVALCHSVAGSWMLWFLLVMFLLHYSSAWKPTWRKNVFSCGEFEMKNKNRTLVIGSEVSRDYRPEARDKSVLLSTRETGRNSWSQRQVVCTGLCPHHIWLLPLYWIYIFFQLIVFDILQGLHTSPSEWHPWSMKLGVCETWWRLGTLWGQCPLGCVGWLFRSEGAELVQMCPCCFLGVLPPLEPPLSCAWSCLGDSMTVKLGTRSAVCGTRVLVLSWFLCPLLCSRVFVLRRSVKARKWDHITLSFLSGLHDCIFWRLPGLIKRGPCSLASYCRHCLFLLKHFVLTMVSKSKLDLMSALSDPAWSVGNGSVKRKDN